MNNLAKRFILILLAATLLIANGASEVSAYNTPQTVERGGPAFEEGSCSATPQTSELEGFKLPATKGYMGNEDPVDENGNLTTTGEGMAYGKFAKLGQNYRDFYITMRWTTHEWFWDGSARVADQAQIAWLNEAPRKVLVTNPRSNRSIIAVVMESGPAPWTGVDTERNNDPKQGWQQPQLGTPAEYGGRVSGFPPVAVEALLAQQRTGGQTNGDELLYSWAPDQNAEPGPTDLSVQNSDSTAICAPTGLGVSPDGFVFPLITTKTELKKGGWNPNCVNKVSSMGALGTVVRIQGLCHHDYLAADILDPVGTKVVAVRPGRVIRANSEISCFSPSVTIFSDPALGGDGNTYYTTHMGQQGRPTEDTIVNAGDIIGEIGDPHGCFPPHLHIDVSPIQTGFPRNSGGTHGPLLDPQPALKASYQTLPE
ncbi:MAG TPA: M23 family metallopeptidase [Candidatus Saccharimonadales bacterium]|nr:M23 family metallopeptidase [Candidatus Saccharimonadales bacterium]